MSVSRAVYDAALKRVREASCCNVELLKECPRCERVTLAALGLDEPPTEEAKPVHTQECEDRAFIFHASTGDDAPCICGAAVPPSEPPKACPTCGSGWTYHHACPDRGSGIDGGTAA